MNPTITFHFNETSFILKHRRAIKESIKDSFKRNQLNLVSLSFVFCTDDFLLKVNQDYLRHDYYTDIITFDLSDDEGVKGEIYISVDRVRENAQIHQVSFILELYRVIFHGVLHLCGFKDKTPSQKTEMTKSEDKELALLLKRFT